MVRSAGDYIFRGNRIDELFDWVPKKEKENSEERRYSILDDGGGRIALIWIGPKIIKRIK